MSRARRGQSGLIERGLRLPTRPRPGPGGYAAAAHHARGPVGPATAARDDRPMLPERLRDAGLSAWGGRPAWYPSGPVSGPHLVSGPHPLLLDRAMQVLIRMTRCGHGADRGADDPSARPGPTPRSTRPGPGPVSHFFSFPARLAARAGLITGPGSAPGRSVLMAR
jgi:hypothetical protein